jgi:hypothetical protein
MGFSEKSWRKLSEIWRRGWDLNPRYPLRYVRFRGGSFQPLTHLSASYDRQYLRLPFTCFSNLNLCHSERSEESASCMPTPGAKREICFLQAPAIPTPTAVCEKTPAADPRNARSIPLREPPSYDLAADDLPPASPNRPHQLSHRRRRTPAA